MQINSEIWGAPFVEYWGYNERTGATDLSDPDFETYEPFIRNNMNPDYVAPLGETFTYSLRAAYYKENSPFEFNKDFPDYSVAYIGVQNPDMPQCNVECYGPADDSPSGSTIGVPCFKTDRNAVAAIAFVSDRPMRSYRSVNQYAVPSNEFENITFRNTQGVYNNGIWCVSPHYRDVTNAWVNRNHVLDCAYWRSLGLRSFFGVIYVYYCDATVDAHNIPTKYDYPKVTLHWYESQTAEWRAAHPIYQANLELCFRSNTNGLYSMSYNPGDGITPDLTYNLKINPDYVTSEPTDTKIISPTTMFGDGNNYTQWPLFGHNKRGTLIGQWGTVSSSGGMSSGHYPMYVGAHKGQQHRGIGSASYERQMYITYDDDDYEWFRQGAGAYGVFFTDGDANDDGYADLFAAGNDNYRWVNDKMCLGIVDENGYTHGEYTRGMSNPTAPNFVWANTTQSPYNPKIIPDKPNQYADTTTFNTIGNLATMFKRYVINAANVEQLGRDLFKITADINTADVDEPTKYNVDINSSFLTNNPINCIISLKRFPLEIPSGSQAVENIKLGTHTCTATGYSMNPTSYMFLYELEETIKPNFGDSYLDYSPYTAYELYVPFCGTVKLDPRDIIGRRLAVQSLVDFVTGTVTAFVMSNNLVIETVQGNIAIEIPVAGIDSATIAGNLNNAVANSKLAYTNVYQASADLIHIPKSVGGTFGKLANANVTAPTQFAQAQYDLQHQQAEPHVIGSASSVGLWAIDLNCRLICYFPTGDIISVTNGRPYLNDKALEYGATTGFACLITDKTLGAFNGMTIAVNPLLGGQTTNNGKALTADELTLLKDALQDGIIL